MDRREAVQDALFEIDAEIEKVDVFISALTAAGYAIVPLRPTPEMIEAGHNAHPNTYGPGVAPCVVHYRAMLSASEGKG